MREKPWALFVQRRVCDRPKARQTPGDGLRIALQLEIRKRDADRRLPDFLSPHDPASAARCR